MRTTLVEVALTRVRGMFLLNVVTPFFVFPD